MGFFKKLANVVVPAKAIKSITSKKQRNETVKGVTNTVRQLSRVATATPRALGSIVRTGNLKGFSVAGKGSLKKDIKDFGVGGAIIGTAAIAGPAAVGAVKAAGGAKAALAGAGGLTGLAKKASDIKKTVDQVKNPSGQPIVQKEELDASIQNAKNEADKTTLFLVLGGVALLMLVLNKKK